MKIIYFFLMSQVLMSSSFANSNQTNFEFENSAVEQELNDLDSQYDALNKPCSDYDPCTVIKVEKPSEGKLKKLRKVMDVSTRKFGNRYTLTARGIFYLKKGEDTDKFIIKFSKIKGRHVIKVQCGNSTYNGLVLGKKNFVAEVKLTSDDNEYCEVFYRAQTTNRTKKVFKNFSFSIN